MKLFYLYLLSLIFALSVRGQAPDATTEPSPNIASLSLSDVTQAVLANNLSIKSSLKKWNAMKARISQAAAWDDPTVSFEEKLDRFVSVSSNAFADQVLSVGQMIPVSGKNRSRARTAAAEALSTFEEVRRQELDVLAQARASYSRLANVYAQIELNRQNLVSLKQIADISRANYQAGNQSAAFVLNAEIEYSKLLEARRDLDQQLAVEESQLNVLMNRDAFAPIGEPAEGDLQPAIPSIEKLRELILADRPEVRMAEAKVEQEKANLQLAHREWIPDPTINLQAQRYNDASQTASELDAAISFNVPWVNYRKYSAESNEAEDNLEAAQNDLERIKVEAIGMLRDAFEKVETPHHHIELYRGKLVPQAQQAFEASQLGYQSGKVSFLDWITAQHNLRDLESMERQALSDYQVATAELEAVVGADLNSISPASIQTKSK
jgi:outer membrane protein TolC